MAGASFTITRPQHRSSNHDAAAVDIHAVPFDHVRFIELAGRVVRARRRSPAAGTNEGIRRAGVSSAGYARRIGAHRYLGVEGGVDVGFFTYMIYAGRHFAEHDGWSYEEKDGFENKELFEILHGNLFVRHEYADWWQIDTGLRSSLFLHFDSSDDDAGSGVFAGAYMTAMFGWKHFKLGPRVQAGVFYEHEGEFGVFLQPLIGRIAYSW
jgi:hypothetical protein